MNINSTLPTDYGPDTASPFARAFGLPPGERPTMRELIKLGRANRPTLPNHDRTDTIVSEWLPIPSTTRKKYIVDGDALTIADAHGGLDWHDAWHYARYDNEPRRTAMLSTDRPGNPVLAHIREHWLADDRIIDARDGLARKGHPDAQGDGPPIWAEAHERTTVDRVLRIAVGHPFPPTPHHPDRMLDRRTVYRWVATEEQLQWVKATLLAIADELPATRAIAIQNWVTHVVDNEEPTE